ncbi:hypothetical protein MNB_SV-15-934 [hydrothermal vent metagenome]|uniref:Uncharacterized protein n=1 Tax=hydrothermal vent metagenome TaxID=652676 RepID=A0A1W1EKG3_9ZZZZ
MDHFTETTHTGYGTNIANSFKGIVVGIILILISIGVLWWNEGRSVAQATALNEMKEKIITLPNTKYDAQYNNKAVLLQGSVKPLSQLEDTIFGLKNSGLNLRRNVEMYQWQERTSSHTEDKLGGGTETVTTYDYYKVWSSSQIYSSSFKHPSEHQNPTMAYQSQSFTTDASMGDYHLSKNIVSRFGTSSSVGDLSSLPQNINGVINKGSYLYKGYNPTQPQIGDLKITFTYTPSGDYTVAGKLQNRDIVAYTTKNGKNFIFTRSGIVSATQLFQEELDSNSMMTWVLRFFGLLFMFIGFNMILKPLSTLANVVPMFGSLVGGVTGVIAGAITLILGSIVIALAWFASRPMMSLTIIGVGVVIGLILSKMGKKDVVASTPPPSRETPQSRVDNVEENSSSTPPPRGTPPPRR